MFKSIHRVVFYTLILGCIPLGILAQDMPEPPKEAGVFLEIVGGLDLDETVSDTDSVDVRFNAYLIPPANPSVESFHVTLTVNGGEDLLDFTFAANGTGAPEGVEIFDEEGIWYIHTESYTGVGSYSFGCSAIYSDGSESSPIMFTSD